MTLKFKKSHSVQAPTEQVAQIFFLIYVIYKLSSEGLFCGGLTT